MIVCDNMPEKKLINTIPLENDLCIKIYDGSKKIAADRWQIVVTARIRIAMDQVQFTRVDSEKKSEIIQLIGDQVVYEKKMIRNFVDQKIKEETITTLCESFLQNTGDYLSHHLFAERFVLKTYADSLENRKWVSN